jgi:hypothetical protein
MAVFQHEIIDIDNDELFTEKDWIGRGKKYDWTNLPGYVTSAKDASFEIPHKSFH